MKKIFFAAIVLLALVSCDNDANDGDAATDTTEFYRDTSAAFNPMGDTSMIMGGDSANHSDHESGNSAH